MSNLLENFLAVPSEGIAGNLIPVGQRVTATITSISASTNPRTGETQAEILFEADGGETRKIWLNLRGFKRSKEELSKAELKNFAKMQAFGSAETGFTEYPIDKSGNRFVDNERTAQCQSIAGDLVKAAGLTGETRLTELQGETLEITFLERGEYKLHF